MKLGKCREGCSGAGLEIFETNAKCSEDIADSALAVSAGSLFIAIIDERSSGKPIEDRVSSVYHRSLT
jgi:hypothetical protein